MANLKRSLSIIVPILVILALIGFGNLLITNPIKILVPIAVIAAIVAIVYFLYKNNAKQSQSNEKKYQRAVKQSKKKYAQNAVPKAKAKKQSNVINYSVGRSHKKSNKRKKAKVNLTVIDGKKGKKNIQHREQQKG